jgi:hypothetical protein
MNKTLVNNVWFLNKRTEPLDEIGGNQGICIQDHQPGKLFERLPMRPDHPGNGCAFASREFVGPREDYRAGSLSFTCGVILAVIRNDKQVITFTQRLPGLNYTGGDDGRLVVSENQKGNPMLQLVICSHTIHSSVKLSAWLPPNAEFCENIHISGNGRHRLMPDTPLNIPCTT